MMAEASSHSPRPSDKCRCNEDPDNEFGKLAEKFLPQRNRRGCGQPVRTIPGLPFDYLLQSQAVAGVGG